MGEITAPKLDHAPRNSEIPTHPRVEQPLTHTHTHTHTPPRAPDKNNTQLTMNKKTPVNAIETSLQRPWPRTEDIQLEN